MPVRLVSIITSDDPALRNTALDAACAGLSRDALLAECDALDAFRRESANLYERVRALFFLYAIHRFHLPRVADAAPGLIPFRGYEQLLQRRFEEAIDSFLKARAQDGATDGLCSALAAAYHRLAFQTLADQVRRSVRSVRGNQWMFRMGHPDEQPLRLRPELLRKSADGTYPILREQTPVRMDLTHSAWSDIFFLGMDFPDGARVLNVSIDLGVHGRDASPRPPVEAYLRVIDEPLLRLTSVDLGATADITTLSDVFDFAKDYLGLLKAGIIASGIVPPGIEGSGQSLADLLARIAGDGRGLELVTSVNGIPKGSRLAVSTNLLAAIVGVGMRATRQAASLEGPLAEPERRLVLARALLGEWLGGSGGGWQDSGGVWPGIKLIEGAPAAPGDPEHGISRGRLMPTHHVFDRTEIPASARDALQSSLVLVHGGMAQNVGPILEMVTEKYLLRSADEWRARQDALGLLDRILGSLKTGDIADIGAATTQNFREPIQTIIPWASTHYTELLIARVRAAFGGDFLGFWMLGGMSGGGMGFIFNPARRTEAQARLAGIMRDTKRELAHALPFAMEPVVYDFAINENGTFATLLRDGDAMMPAAYYTAMLPPLLRQERRALSGAQRAEMDKFGAACRSRPELSGMVQTLFDVMLPRGQDAAAGSAQLAQLLDANGFDRTQHEQIRADLRNARIGLAQNRLAANSEILDVRADDVFDASQWNDSLAAHAGSGAAVPAVITGVPPGRPEAHPGPDGTESLLLFSPFDPSEPISITRRRLPHWRMAGATYFITFRLADSLPAEVQQQMQREREQMQRGLSEKPSASRTAELAARIWELEERHLDQGHGDCVLRDAGVSAMVEGALRHFDGERYALGSFVIMPNHVHALVTPVAGHALSELLHSWKSFTAHEISRRHNRPGRVWQDETFDHIVRDDHSLERISRYIAENPEKAGLAEGAFKAGCGSGGAVEMAAPQGAGNLPGGTPAVTAGTAAPLPLHTATARRETGDYEECRAVGMESLRNGEVAVVTLAAGAGSRWTQGAGVCKALHPFAKLGGGHRTFLETHLAKSRRTARVTGTPLPHVFTTSYATHEPTAEFLARQENYGYPGAVRLSEGRAVGLRMIPMVRDLRHLWEETPQQLLDEQQQKVRESGRSALMNWARSAGEGADYTDNVPLQCLHPVGHWFEVPNLLRNGLLHELLSASPKLKYLLVHNIDTLGATADPALLGGHIRSGATLSFEMIARRLEDRGGGLARVDGRVRIVEGLAIPHEEDEFRLRYYNTLTNWVSIDGLLALFGLSRGDLTDAAKVSNAVRHLAARMPTYVTLKEVKKRWGHGHEDVFPVAQFEKLWGDMSTLPEANCRYVVVPRQRGQQLKDQAQLDGWLRDGSAAHVESLCEWG